MTLLAVDDTDSREGMCTTYIAFRLASEGPFDVIGLPRLVRLNPTIPFKTRGNGAIVLRLGEGKGEAFQIGEGPRGRILAYPKGSPAPEEEIMEVAESLVEELAERGSSPGIVVSRRRPREGLYWRGVRGYLERDDVVRELRDIGASFKGGRGVIGAAAAMAWRARRCTYEALVYGDPGKRPTREHLLGVAKEIEGRFPQTFDNLDVRKKEPLIAPRAPTPVVAGIRSVDWKILPEAVGILKMPREGWIVYKTNQGTDDHLLRMRISDISEYSNPIVEGVVVEPPKTVEGGHVVVKVSDGTGEIWLAAYEPTGSFRSVVKRLRVGDLVRGMGSYRPEPEPTINLEKLAVLRVSRPPVKVSNPKCPVCWKPMESMGSWGFRCPRHSIRMPYWAARFAPEPRDLSPGIYEADPAARRHLSMPLKITPLGPCPRWPP